MCGDFNSIWCANERTGRGATFRQVDADMFNNFIVDTLLIDLPICGRLYT